MMELHEDPDLYYNKGDLGLCPECGGQPEIKWETDPCRKGFIKYVSCPRCGAQTQYYATIQEAVNEWETYSRKKVKNVPVSVILPGELHGTLEFNPPSEGSIVLLDCDEMGKVEQFKGALVRSILDKIDDLYKKDQCILSNYYEGWNDALLEVHKLVFKFTEEEE